MQLLTSGRTRAYRMKLKEWGFMRHKPRKVSTKRTDGAERSQSVSQRGDEEERSERDSSTTAELMPIDLASIEPSLVESSYPKSKHPGHCTERGGWEIVPDAELAHAEPSFMGMLHQAPT
jgi:hypothetical protein